MYTILNLNLNLNLMKHKGGINNALELVSE